MGRCQETPTPLRPFLRSQLPVAPFVLCRERSRRNKGKKLYSSLRRRGRRKPRSTEGWFESFQAKDFSCSSVRVLSCLLPTFLLPKKGIFWSFFGKCYFIETQLSGILVGLFIVSRTINFAANLVSRGIAGTRMSVHWTWIVRVGLLSVFLML